MSKYYENKTTKSVTHRRCCTLIFYLFILFLLTAYSLSLNATIRYVSKTGSSVPPFLTWETASDSIQKCINVCVFGDTIYVANGVYQEQVVMIPGLALVGSGTDSCIVDSRSFPLTNNRTIIMKDACLITGFYIRTSNNLDRGQGIRAEGQTGLITKNKFSNANSGVLLWLSDVEVYKNYFFSLRIGVDMYNSNSIIAKNEINTLTVSGNHGFIITADNSTYKPILDSNCIHTNGDGISKGPGSRLTLKNNEIKLVNGATGIFLHSYFSDSAWVYNNLVYAESGIQGFENIGVPNLQLYNNYFTGNFDDQQNIRYILRIGSYNNVKNNGVTNGERGVEAWGTQGLQFEYNNVWNNDNNYSGFTPDTTNLSADPIIVNDDTTQGDLDFHLEKYSPLIDAGDPTILDKDGTRSDIGLYGGPYGESYIYVDLPPRTPVNLTANVDTLIKLNWNKNTEADFSYYNVYRDTTFDFTVDSIKLIGSLADTFYYQTFPSDVETLYYKLTAVDNQGNESNPSEQVYVKLVSVKNEWMPVNNYILYQNYPNPFNPSTRIGYKLKERGYVKLYVYDIKGELVSVLVNEVQEAGYYEVDFSVGQESIPVLSSGVYIYQIFIKGENNIPVFSDIKKMIYVK